MDSPCKELFSRSAFAEQKDRCVRLGDLLHCACDCLQGGMLSYDAWKPIALRIGFLQDDVFALQLLAFNCAAQQLLEMIQVDGLLNKVVSAGPHRFDCLRYRAVGGHED